MEGVVQFSLGCQWLPSGNQTGAIVVIPVKLDIQFFSGHLSETFVLIQPDNECN